MRNSLAEARGAREASETSVTVISKRQSVASEQGMGYTFIMIDRGDLYLRYQLTLKYSNEEEKKVRKGNVRRGKYRLTGT